MDAQGREGYTPITSALDLRRQLTSRAARDLLQFNIQSRLAGEWGATRESHPKRAQASVPLNGKRAS